MICTHRNSINVWQSIAFQIGVPRPIGIGRQKWAGWSDLVCNDIQSRGDSGTTNKSYKNASIFKPVDQNFKSTEDTQLGPKYRNYLPGAWSTSIGAMSEKLYQPASMYCCFVASSQSKSKYFHWWSVCSGSYSEPEILDKSTHSRINKISRRFKNIFQVCHETNREQTPTVCERWELLSNLSTNMLTLNCIFFKIKKPFERNVPGFKISSIFIL